jgi:hypothetical protein
MHDIHQAMRCQNCSTIIPHHAKYCPKCGTRAAEGPSKLPVAPDAHPAKAPIPRAGKLFIVFALLGISLAALGIAGGMSEFTYTGAAVLAVVALVLVVGHHVS